MSCPSLKQLGPLALFRFLNCSHFFKPLGMRELDLKTSAHFFKDLQVGSPTRSIPDQGRWWLSPSEGIAREGAFGGTWLLVRGWGGSEAWLMRANWLCQVGTALAWHHFKSYRSIPWKRCVLFCSVTGDMTSLLPQGRGEGLQTWDPQELFWLIKQGPHCLIFFMLLF